MMVRFEDPRQDENRVVLVTGDSNRNVTKTTGRPKMKIPETHMSTPARIWSVRGVMPNICGAVM